MGNREKGSQIAAMAVVYVAPVLSVIINCVLLQKEMKLLLPDLVYTLVAANVFYIYFHMEDNRYLKSIRHPVIFWGSFVLSFVLLGARGSIPVGALWLLAVMVATLDLGPCLAVPVHMLLLVQYTILILPFEKNYMLFSAYIILGFLFVVLCSALKNAKGMPYFLIILVTVSTVLQLAVFQFAMHDIIENAMLIGIEVVSVLFIGVLCGVYIIFIGDKNTDSETETEDDTYEDELSSEEIAATESFDQLTRQDLFFLQIIMEPDFDLFVRLQQYSLPLMSHSMRISGLSEGAAEVVGAQPLLAKAGGLYHEVGRITDEDDYIEAGTQIARQYRFPKALINVIRQHSTGFEKPSTKEAAVVMLSDCIVSTSDYLEDTGKRAAVSDRHLVNSIFQNRMEKGNLDEAGFSQEQIEKLKEYYVNNAFS